MKKTAGGAAHQPRAVPRAGRPSLSSAPTSTRRRSSQADARCSDWSRLLKQGQYKPFPVSRSRSCSSTPARLGRSRRVPDRGRAALASSTQAFLEFMRAGNQPEIGAADPQCEEGQVRRTISRPQLDEARSPTSTKPSRQRPKGTARNETMAERSSDLQDCASKPSGNIKPDHSGDGDGGDHEAAASFQDREPTASRSVHARRSREPRTETSAGHVGWATRSGNARCSQRRVSGKRTGLLIVTSDRGLVRRLQLARAHARCATEERRLTEEQPDRRVLALLRATGKQGHPVHGLARLRDIDQFLTELLRWTRRSS